MNRLEYKERTREVKREVAKAKHKAYEELYDRLDTKGEKDLYRLARQKSSWKGCAEGEVDQGQGWKYYHKYGVLRICKEYF